MEKLLFLILFAVGANCYYINNGNVSKHRIVGGEYTDITSVPYLAQIFRLGSHECGAAILSPHWIVTAAHCFDKDLKGLDISIYDIITGSSLRGRGKLNKVTQVFIHDRYDPVTVDNDISLIQVKDPIVFNESQKKITISRKPPKANQKVKISGFGNEATDVPSLPTVKAGFVSVMDYDDCTERFKDGDLTHNMFCAESSKVDTCQGDSGGPVVYDDQLVGVVSWGYGCLEGTPGVYTQVANYINWINDKTGLSL